MAFLYIVFGLGLLVLGGEWLVRGASGVALKLKITPLIVGLTIVSFATSAPELIVSVRAAFTGHPDISLGNVIGSNIANIGLILGIIAIGFSLPVTWFAYRSDWWIMIFSTLLLGVFAIDGELSSVEGVLLVSALVGYIYLKIRHNKRGKEVDVEVDEDTQNKSIFFLFAFLLIGVAALRFGAEFLVEGAVDLALSFGVEERIVSLTIVAFGTSVPELATSVIAARKGEKEMAIGNIIGSNIFNILSVLGFSAIITSIPVQNASLMEFDFWWMLGFALILWPLMKYFKKEALGRVEGGIMLLIYVLYVVILINSQFNPHLQ